MKPHTRSLAFTLVSLLFFTVISFAQPANNLCTSTTVVTPATTCTNLTSQTLFNATAVGSPTNGAGTTNDVWYSVTTPANIRNIQITVTPTGTRNVSYTNATTYIEVFATGACAAGVFTGTSLGTTDINNSLSLNNLAPSTLYYFRVFTTAAPTAGAAANWQFSICATYTLPPANDVCSAPTNLTPQTTCGATTGQTVLGATNYNSPTNTAGTTNDVWYTFTTPANTRNVQIAVTGLGANLNVNNTFIEAFTGGTCAAGVFTGTSIGTTAAGGPVTLSLTGLAPSTQYYFRVFTTGTAIGGTTANWGFSVCVSYTAVPANDNCAGAVTLTVGTANAAGTVQNATASAENAGCAAGTPDDDVWYKFTTSATQTYASISLTPGATLKANGAMLQLYSGSCGGLTSIACGQEEITVTGGLSPSTQYYVRVYSSAAYVTAPAVGTTSNNFSILVSSPARANITAGKMNEVYRQTILSPANVLADPWEITYGPDNYLWITEAKGYKVNRMNPVTGANQVVLDISQNSTFLPVADQPFNAQFDIVAHNPQGGFAGLALHPNFTGAPGGENYVYVSYVHSWISGIAYTNRIVRFLYNPSTNRLESPVAICDTIPGSGDHNSQRMIIAPATQGGSDYYLFYAAGDMGAGQQFPTSANVTRPNKAQKINSYEGKILRFALSDTCSGTGNQMWIPASNPYNDVAPIVGKSAVWSTGIRNNQGFAYNPSLHILYGASHGAFSDDEINIIEGFKNYGHPLIIGYADGNYNGTTTPGLSTSISAGVPYGYTDATYTVKGQAAAVGTCPPIGNEVTNMNTINASAALYGAYKDPIFCAYPGPASGTGSIPSIWSAATTPGNAGWHSEAWSGLGLYTSTYIPGWKNALLAAGLKWGRAIRLKLNAAGTAVIPTAGADTATYFQSTNRYRDMAFSPNGRDIYLAMDKSPASSAATVGNPTPTVAACAGCIVRYEFLGYAGDGTAVNGSTVSKSIDVTTGTANTCNTGTTVTIDAANGNTNLWVPITGPDGNIMAEINAMGQNLGVVTSSFFRNPSGSLRYKAGVPYLDRNITITPTINGPYGTPVKVRLYITKTEFDDFVNDPLTALTNINQLKVLKNNDPCGAAVSNNTTTQLNPTNTSVPADMLQGTVPGYVLQVNVSSFSSFYFAENNVVLPLDLITFTGSLQNNTTTLLKWKTDNEINTSHFEVERSVDGINFKGIGSVAASGNTSSSRDYTFTDADAANQGATVLYYRLKVADINGSYKYTNTISITLSVTKGAITVSPNPALNDLKASIVSPTAGSAVWQIIDNTGRSIMYGNILLKKGNNDLPISIKRLAAGTYYLHVSGTSIDVKTQFQKL
jgi:glucose/arabinose dehydrogenase